jgi:DNA ligase 1
MNSDQIYDLLYRIGQESARSEKERLLSLIVGYSHGERVLRDAYDPMVTYGVTIKAGVRDGGETFSEGDEVWDLLDALRKRELTGNAAKAALASTLVRLTTKSQRLLVNILSKDLRCGITATTVNKVLPGTVPVFAVMLAHKYEEKRITKFPVALEPKLDGLRVICLVRDGVAKFFSRTGKPFPALDHLGPDVVTTVGRASETMDTRIDQARRRQIFGDRDQPSLAIDAEVISGTFNKTTGDVRRKGEQAEDAVLNIFDAVPYDFLTGDQAEWGSLFKSRRVLVNLLAHFAPIGSAIRATPISFADSHRQIQEIYDRYRRAGYEGAMVKPLDGLYSKKRSHAWLKMKNQDSEDLRITGYFEGTGKYEGKLGGLIVDRNGISVRVGGGFSDEQREKIWIYRSEYIGRLIEVEFHEVTPDGSLRHPRFVAWRWDKDEVEAAE